jgi:hypothetical protein
MFEDPGEPVAGRGMRFPGLLFSYWRNNKEFPRKIKDFLKN